MKHSTLIETRKAQQLFSKINISFLRKLTDLTSAHQYIIIYSSNSCNQIVNPELMSLEMFAQIYSNNKNNTN